VKTQLDIPRGLQGQLWRYGPAAGESSSHHHGLLELEHVVQGSAKLAVGGRQHVVVARSLIWVPPGLEHQVVDHSDDFDMWIACFRPGLVRRSCGDEAVQALLARHGPGPEPRVLLAAEARRLCALLAEVSVYEEPAAYNAGLGYLLAHAWLQYRHAEA